MQTIADIEVDPWNNSLCMCVCISLACNLLSVVSLVQELQRQRTEGHEQSLDDRVHLMHITNADLEGK